jgi:cyclopropane fatty-acyl-phospholipid synthase-like methyltransferase
VHLLDYRSLPETFTCVYYRLLCPSTTQLNPSAFHSHAFDRVVSIEMIEAVGKEFLPTYFEVVDRVLKVDRGIAVVQVITMPEARFESYGK